MKLRTSNVYIAPDARAYIDNVSGEWGRTPDESPKPKTEKQTQQEKRQSSYSVLMLLTRAQRSNIYDAMTEEIENPALLDLYRQIVLDKKPLRTIPLEYVDAFFEDLEASSGAQEVLFLGKTGAGRPSVHTEHVVYPAGRMVPSKPSLSDYDMLRDLSAKYKARYGVWHEDDDHGE